MIIIPHLGADIVVRPVAGGCFYYELVSSPLADVRPSSEASDGVKGSAKARATVARDVMGGAFETDVHFLEKIIFGECLASVGEFCSI